MHDQVASTVALARTLLMGVDLSCVTTPVQTASLKLILETLIELGAEAPSPLPKALPRKSVAEAARKTIAGHLAEFEQHREG